MGRTQENAVTSVPLSNRWTKIRNTHLIGRLLNVTRKGLSDIPAGLTYPTTDHVLTDAQIPGHLGTGNTSVPHLLDRLV